MYCLFLFFIWTMYCFGEKNITIKPIVNVKLNTKNSLILRGEVNDKSVSRLIYQINKLDNTNDIYLYLDTPGGSVESGHKLISEIINHNITCIAEKAYSMGFAILQSCTNRYILRHGKLMIHQVKIWN